jgi:hypothetical protein
MHGQQQENAQHQDGRDDQLGARAGMVTVNMVSGSPARRAPALNDRSGTLCADQVFAAHRNPFRLARTAALAAK